MERSNPIFADYKSLLVFQNMGRRLLQQLTAAMNKPAYSTFFKNIKSPHPNELTFTYHNLLFKTRMELFFRNDKLPDHAFIATYYMSEQPLKEEQEIVSYSFDLKYNVNDIYTEENFAGYYLIDFHQNLKKYYSDEHKPFPIRMDGK